MKGWREGEGRKDGRRYEGRKGDIEGGKEGGTNNEERYGGEGEEIWRGIWREIRRE